jgi:hypothetical protein
VAVPARDLLGGRGIDDAALHHRPLDRGNRHDGLLLRLDLVREVVARPPVAPAHDASR